LFITEIVGDDADGSKVDDDDGFVEIWNATSGKIDLNNVRLRYYDASKPPSSEVDLNGILDPGEYIVLTQNNTAFTAQYGFPADFVGSDFSFDGGTDGVDIYYYGAKAEIIDSFNDNAGPSTFTWDPSYNYKRNTTDAGSTEGNWTGTPGPGDPGEYPDNPLPVTLSSFFADYVSETLSVHWTTASETNNSHWNVYRASSNNFSESIKVNYYDIEGAGTSSEPKSYLFVDETDYNENSTYFYWIQSVDLSGNSQLYGSISIYIPEDHDNENPPDVGFVGLKQNYPNPFNPETEIMFALKESADATLTVYNVQGQKVSVLYNEYTEAGTQTSIKWDGTDKTGKAVASGIYFYKLSTKFESHMRKMLLIK